MTQLPTTRPLPRAAAPSAPTPTPYALTGGHFLFALLCLGWGAPLLPGVARDLALGNPFAPRTFAAVHLFALGTLGSSIAGALYQFYPMSLGVPLRNLRVGYTGLVAWTGGVTVLVTGFLAWTPALIAAGWGSILLAMGATSWNLLPARRKTKVPGGAVIGAYVTAGHSFLGLAMAIGMARIGDAFGWWTTDRLALVATHLHLGVLGFGTLTALGVGSRMLPMFLLSGPVSPTPLRAIGPALSAGLLIQGTGLIAGWPTVTMIGSATLLAGALGIVALFVSWLRGRHRPLGGGLELLPAATLWLFLASWLGAGLLLSGGSSLVLWGAYAMAGLLGWLILLVLAVLFRILPHMSYLHLFGRRGGPALPVDALVHGGMTRAASLFLPTSLALLVAGILLRQPDLAAAGGWGWIAGTALLLTVFGRMYVILLRPL